MLPLRATAPSVSAPPLNWVETGSLTVQALASEHEREVLSFLAERPLHTVVMAGLIRDNGLVSPLNRGSFYACRDREGRLEGVSLIGHITMFETRTEAALERLARFARDCQRIHAILGEQSKIERFGDLFAEAGQEVRLVCREILFEQQWPVAVREAVPMRQATLDDLDLVVPVHARMAFEESGVNPLERDPVGFQERTARRIEQGRVWVWREAGRLIFKADIISDTPEAIYLEGIYLNPEERGKGYGARCVSQLSRSLLERTRSVCLLVNERNREGQSCYRRAGFKMRGFYDTIYLDRQSS